MNAQEKTNNFLRLMRGEQIGYVPFIADLEMSYICEYANLNLFEGYWNYEQLLGAFEKVLQDI